MTCSISPFSPLRGRPPLATFGPMRLQECVWDAREKWVEVCLHDLCVDEREGGGGAFTYLWAQDPISWIGAIVPVAVVCREVLAGGTLCHLKLRSTCG